MNSELFKIIQPIRYNKRESRGAAHAAKSLRWSVNQLMKYLIRTINITAGIPASIPISLYT